MREAIKETSVRLALKPRSKTARKRRVMLLWESGILSAGDTERIFMLYGLMNNNI